jgi:hypothetical protein
MLSSGIYGGRTPVRRQAQMRKTRRYTAGAAGEWASNALNIDGEIQHLERVLAGEGAHSIFARTYWRERLLQAFSTPGLIPAQRERLNRLLSQLDDHSSRT